MHQIITRKKESKEQCKKDQVKEILIDRLDYRFDDYS